MEGKRVGLTGDWDGRISRRTLLRTGGSAAAGLFVLGRAASARAAPPFEGDPFSLGVASGDPTPDGTVLWTRLAPAPLEEHGGLIDEPYGVRYEVAADKDFRTIVRRGAVDALYDEAHTVHAEIAGLQPSTDYWYRLKFGTAVSPVGRTRTAPPAGWIPTEPEAPFRFAFVSCQNYRDGFDPAYRDLALQGDLALEDRIELVVHLGDYIYEGPGLAEDRVRDHAPPTELLLLGDYRIRHAQYRTDPDLQAAHRDLPWLMTWDDHEFDNNYANLVLDEPVSFEVAAARRAAAYQAYWEHAPLSRSRKPVGKDMNLYRRAHWGALATFHVLDTRQYRDDQMEEQCALAERLAENGYYCPEQVAQERTILGAAQRDWLLEGLSAHTSGWNVLANQVGFAPQDDAERLDRWRFFVDPWDGYVADRQRVLNHLKDNTLYNTVVITGDKHQHSVRNVPESYLHIDGPAIATEFVGTSISSGSDNHPDPITTHGGDANNPHILLNDYHRGYVRVELTRDTWRSDFRVVDTVRNPDTKNVPAWTLESWIVQNGEPGALPASGEPSAV
jgi:alkaline phosphatase D